MHVDQTKFIFNRVIEHAKSKKRSAFEQYFPRALLHTLDPGISDPLEIEASHFLRLQMNKAGKLEVSMPEGEKERKTLVEIYRKMIEAEWAHRNFDEVVRLCRVARSFDEENLDILGILGRAKWEMGDESGLEILEHVASKNIKFESFYSRALNELAERDKLAKRMSQGIFSDENVSRAKQLVSPPNSLSGKLFKFFVFAAYLLFFIAIVLAVLI
jgi:hypothetical protein